MIPTVGVVISELVPVPASERNSSTIHLPTPTQVSTEAMGLSLIIAWDDQKNRNGKIPRLVRIDLLQTEVHI